MAPLKARPRRTSGLLPSCTGTGPPLAALALPRYVDELLKDSKTWWVFTWKDCSDNIHTKKPKSVPAFQDLPSQNSSACGDLNPRPLLDIGMAQRRPGSTSTNKVKEPSRTDVCTRKAPWWLHCRYAEKREDFCYTAPRPVSQGSSVSPVPHASERAGIVTGFRHLV